MSDSRVVPIDKCSVHKICSGQVILDLATSVKEVIENALDAQARSIEVSLPHTWLMRSLCAVTSSILYHMVVQIRLKEYGSELIEVADYGTGISPGDYHAVAAKYHTSKISSFNDVQSVESFGFRGEALSSLCAVAQVTITTRTAGQDVGARLTFDHNGNLTGTHYLIKRGFSDRM
jgi:DNA mismatch repair protein PMS2